MTERVVVAPHRTDINGPMIFLAGPIQGTRDWQSDAIKIIQEMSPNIWIANPRRPEYSKDFPEEKYNEQVDWETDYLNKACGQGVILFWLAKENEHDCARSYAQTSRFELGEWIARSAFMNVRLVLGVEDGFSGARYIRKRYAEYRPLIPIRDTLEKTCTDAVNLI